MSVVKRILKHDFTDPNNKLWLVQWQLDGDEDKTWGPFEFLKDVEAFHHYFSKWVKHTIPQTEPCIRTH